MDPDSPAQKFLDDIKELDPRLRRLVEDLEKSDHVIRIKCDDSLEEVRAETNGDGSNTPDADNMRKRIAAGGPNGTGTGSLIRTYYKNLVPGVYIRKENQEARE